jgi:hypothetical protein
MRGRRWFGWETDGVWVFAIGNFWERLKRRLDGVNSVKVLRRNWWKYLTRQKKCDKTDWMLRENDEESLKISKKKIWEFKGCPRQFWSCLKWRMTEKRLHELHKTLVGNFLKLQQKKSCTQWIKSNNDLKPMAKNPFHQASNDTNYKQWTKFEAFLMKNWKTWKTKPQYFEVPYGKLS